MSSVLKGEVEMTAYLFWEFVILIAGVWLMATLFFVYGWLLLKRQKKMMMQFLSLRESEKIENKPKLEDEPKVEPVQLEVSRNEPISKYRDLPPDAVDVSFVEDNK